MSNQSNRDELLRELHRDRKLYFRRGVWRNVHDLSLTILIVLASLLATGLAASDAKYIPRWVIAIVAALPAAAASIQNIIGIRERSNWYFMYAAQINALATTLKFSEADDVQEIALKRAALELKMESEWHKVGHSFATSRIHHDKANTHG
jgi:hypothetical protein